MDVKVIIDETLSRPHLELHTPGSASEARTLAQQIKEAVNTLSADNGVTVSNPQPARSKRLIAWQGEEALLLEPRQVSRFEAQEQRVFAHTPGGRLQMRQRLYELEEQLAGTAFVRISNSEIVNFDLVAGMDLSLAGTILLKLKTGERCYVSRRYMKRIKEYRGL
jgi:DNA-binding LytR/AlgR family response regulator